ncbi:hypothetical protein BgiBS90_026676 [Biomphalaria glabrata]|nr:hypothetical protein BgiBS90_026676 [Biomphalaria glabrata]
MDSAELASEVEEIMILLGFKDPELEDTVRRYIYQERQFEQEREDLDKAHQQEILEIRDSCRPQSLELNSTPARQDQEAEESKTMAHAPTGYTAQTDTEVTAKDETFMPDTPPLNNTTLSTQPDPPAKSNSLCDAPIQPMPSSNTPPKKAPIQQPATHESCNRPASESTGEYQTLISPSPFISFILVMYVLAIHRDW